MKKRILVLFQLIVFGFFLSGCGNKIILKNENINNKDQNKPSASPTTIFIPPTLVSFVADLIPQNYSLQWYNFSKDNNKYDFYFSAKSNNLSNPKLLYPTVTLNQEQGIKLSQLDDGFVSDFDIGSYHFLRFDKINANHAGTETNCSTQISEGIISVAAYTGTWGEFSNCEEFLKSVLNDSYIYPSSFEFKEAQEIYSKLVSNFQDCEPLYINLTSRQNLNDEDWLVQTQTTLNCQKGKIGLKVDYRPQAKNVRSECCLKFAGGTNQTAEDLATYRVVDGYDFCILPGNTGMIGLSAFNYHAMLNTKSYIVEIFFVDKPDDDSDFKKVIQGINSTNIGFDKVDICYPGGV